ncbi:MAG: HD domain-containing protein [Candidatus Magnetoovum sp. WYHC-5]|nr:HD domain-containing protein [Candidatus Magnetoovum sp. WYHC-5]
MEKPKLLLVDDDEALLDSFALKLSFDYDVTKALSPEVAMEELLKGQSVFDACVVDMWMHDDPQAGLKLIERIKTEIPLSPECVVLTAYGKIENASECMEKGAFGYVEKGRAQTNRLLIKTIEKAVRHSMFNRERQSKAILSAMSDTLIRVIENRDPFSHRHSTRITKWASLVGQHMGFSRQKLVDLEIAARLHDIGLALIPDYIATKPGIRTQYEIKIFQTHPQKGYELVKDMPNVSSDILDAILYHHERYDGSGFPEGLKGDEIPTLAMIVRIACDFDNAFSPVDNRALREPGRAADFIGQLSEEGKLAPDIVQHFLELYNKGELTSVDPLRHSDELFKLAKQEAQAHKYIEAKVHCDSALTEVLRENEFFAAALCVAIGDLFMEHKQYKDGSDYYKKSVRLRPGYAEGFYKRGTAFEKQEMWERADWNYALASTLVPAFVEALLARARVLSKGGFFDEAMKTFEKVQGMQHDNPLCYLGKGRVCQQKAYRYKEDGLIDEAKKHWMNAKNHYEKASELLEKANTSEGSFVLGQPLLKSEIEEALDSLSMEPIE